MSGALSPGERELFERLVVAVEKIAVSVEVRLPQPFTWHSITQIPLKPDRRKKKQ